MDVFYRRFRRRQRRASRQSPNQPLAARQNLRRLAPGSSHGLGTGTISTSASSPPRDSTVFCARCPGRVQKFRVRSRRGVASRARASSAESMVMAHPVLLLEVERAVLASDVLRAGGRAHVRHVRPRVANVVPSLRDGYGVGRGGGASVGRGRDRRGAGGCRAGRARGRMTRLEKDADAVRPAHHEREEGHRVRQEMVSAPRAAHDSRVPARAANCPTTGGVVLTSASAERRRARRDRAPRSFESVTDELSIHFYGQLSVNPRSNPDGVNF